MCLHIIDFFIATTTLEHTHFLKYMVNKYTFMNLVLLSKKELKPTLILRLGMFREVPPPALIGIISVVDSTKISVLQNGILLE